MSYNPCCGYSIDSVVNHCAGCYSKNSLNSYPTENFDNNLYNLLKNHEFFINDSNYNDLSIKNNQYTTNKKIDYNNRNYEITSHFNPEIFLKKEERPLTRFINATEEVENLIRESFLATTNQKFPYDITVQVCSKEELKKIHSNFAEWSDEMQGFAINNKRKGAISMIFVKEDNLDGLLVTVGHEIGHVFTPNLKNKKSEEAKAFSFCLAWIKAIKENNIGNLKDCFEVNINPSKNNLHDFAFEFVLDNMKENVMELHWEIARGYLSTID